MNNNELSFIANLIKDRYTNRIATFSNEKAVSHADEAVRNAMFELLGSEELTWQSWRNNKNAIFTIMEDVLSVTLPDSWKTSPFYKRFVQVKNGAIGEKNAFAVKDRTSLVAARFSGGTWDVERQKIGRAKDIQLDTEWSYIDCYDELDRFLKGYITIPEMIKMVQEGFDDDIDTRIGITFNGMGVYLPSQFNESGTYDKDTMADLITRVQTANKAKAVLAGSQRALSKITDGMITAWISEAAKEEMATSGVVLRNSGLGVECLVIPQTFVKNSYDFAVEDNVIYVLPDEQMIKVFYEGDVRAKENTENENHDQTIDIQFQHKVGVGIATSSLFGKYVLA